MAEYSICFHGKSFVLLIILSSIFPACNFASVDVDSYQEFKDNQLSLAEESEASNKLTSTVGVETNSHRSSLFTPPSPRRGLPLVSRSEGRQRTSKRKGNKFPIFKTRNDDIGDEIFKVLGIENRTVSAVNKPKTLPRFMVNLYREVTSNSNNTRMGHTTSRPYDANTVRCISDSASRKDKMRFRFDLSTVPPTEQLLHAELHLFKLLPKRKSASRRHAYYKIELYELSSKSGSDDVVHKLISYRLISARGAGWEIFNVADTVRDWIHNPDVNIGFWVNVTSVTGEEIESGFVRFARSGHENRQPILVVFTKEPVEVDVPEEGESSEEAQAKRQLLSQMPTQHAPIAVGLMEEEVLRPKRATDGDHHNQKKCGRESMYIDFQTIGWGDYILAPRGYDAYRCTGYCPFPVKDDTKYSVHALIQSFVATETGDHGPCCVPHRLGHLVLMFFDTYDNIVLKQVNGMVVEECGCR